MIVATENNSLYAFDGKTGSELWHTNVGHAVAQSTLPCGDIDPLGITGTPVYDPATGLVFAVAEITGPTHLLVGIDVASGKGEGPQVRRYRWHGRYRLSAAVSARVMAGNGLYRLWWSAGDCSDYRGTVLAARTDGSGSLLHSRYRRRAKEASGRHRVQPLTARETSISLSATEAKPPGTWDHSDSILRLSSTLKLEDGFCANPLGR